MAKPKTLYARDFERLAGAARLAPVWAFTGGTEEDYLDATARLRARVVAPGMESFNSVTLEGRELGPGEALTAARTQAMGGGGRLVVLRDPQALAREDREALAAYFREPQPDNCLVVVLGDVEWRNALLQAALAAGVLVSFSPPPGQKFRAVIEGELKRFGLQATAGALDHLERHLPEDRGMLRRELEKVALVAPEGRRLDAEDLAHLVAGAGAADLDRLLSRLAAGDVPAALRVLDTLLDEGVDTPVLVGTLARFFRLALMAKAAGAPGGADRRFPELVRCRVGDRERANEAARRWTEGELTTRLRALVDLDRAAKSGGPARLLLEAMLEGIFPPGAPGSGLTRSPGVL